MDNDDRYRQGHRRPRGHNVLERIADDVMSWFRSGAGWEVGAKGRARGTTAEGRDRDSPDPWPQSHDTQYDRRAGHATRGPYAGVGPKGFRRSPAALEEQVSERLSAHGQVDASDIEVRCEDQEITLSGTVRSRREKQLAESCADSVPGVRDVHNRLTIRRDAAGSGSQ